MNGGGPHKFPRAGTTTTVRGGGGGATKRTPSSLLSHRPPSSRPSAPPPSRGGRNNPIAPTSASAAAAAQEENFRLVPGNPDTFAAFIRLAPDLINEIRRVEEEGGAARIRFDTNRNNPSVNVIDVGGKEFRFTWSQETGDLCDIYEERESGEDGNGLLVGSGCPWRKLNVQRVLDESTKNHVKMRSEEAERKQKSRKAIVLDSSNPSMKSQAKALAAVDVNPWKNFKQSKEPPVKKRKVEPPRVGGLPKTNQKPGFSGTTPVKGRLSTSPAPSPPNHNSFFAPAPAPAPATAPTPAPASVKSNFNKGQAVEADALNVPVPKAQNAIVSERDGLGNSVPSEETARSKGNQDAMPADLQNMLIKLLKENPNGMGLKGLEKAVCNTLPNSGRKIPAILGKIATLHAPGKYLLKPGIELDTKRISAGSERSPEDNQHKLLVPEQSRGAVAQVDLNIAEESPQHLEAQVPLESSVNGEHVNFVERIDVPQHTSDLFRDSKGIENTEGQAGSSSDSGSDSDSDSDSSGSGSDSGSQSRSRSGSPAGSGSGSSSDSESESSGNSKEGSDVDVDIMTSDDEKETRQNKVDMKQHNHGSPDVDIDGHVSEDVEIDDLPADDQEADLAIRRMSAGNAGSAPVQDFHYTFPIEERNQELLKPPDFNGRETMAVDDFRHRKPDSSEKSRGKSKRNADERSEEMPGPAKRSKAPPFSERTKVFPGGFNEDHPKGHYLDAGLPKGVSCKSQGRATSEPEQSGGRASTWLNNVETAQRTGRNDSTRGPGLYQEHIVHADEGLLNKKSSVPSVLQDTQGILSEKMGRKYKESGIKQSVHREFQYRKKGVNGKGGNMEDDFYDTLIGSSPKTSPRVETERPALVNGKVRTLQRELSELELGELREPLQEEIGRDVHQFGEKESMKQVETNRDALDSRNADLSSIRPGSKPASDAGRPSSPIKRSGVSRNSGGSSKRRSTDANIGDPLRTSHKAVSLHLSNSTVDARSLPNRTTERQESESRVDVEGFGETYKKSHDRTNLHESKQEYASNYANGTKFQHSNSPDDANDRKTDDFVNDGCKRSGSSSDEDMSYSKYEKQEPELKGPIKNLSEYKEYVEEFREKYVSYSSLIKIIEAHRKEFEKLGSDLAKAKGRDMDRYHKIVSQLRERYRQSGPKHKRMKKIFAVLHQELQHLKQRIEDFAAAYTKK